MKRVTMIQVLDGRTFFSVGEAKAHAEKLYQQMLMSLVYQAVDVSGNVAMKEFIESRLSAFVGLAEMKNDMKLEEDDRRE